MIEQHQYLKIQISPAFSQLQKLEKRIIICPCIGEPNEKCEEKFRDFVNKNLWIDYFASANQIGYSTYAEFYSCYGNRDYTLMDLIFMILNYWEDKKEQEINRIKYFMNNIQFIKKNQNKLIFQL